MKTTFRLFRNLQLLKNKWLRRKTIAAVLGLSLVPVIGFGSILYIAGSRILQEEINRFSSITINQMREEIELLIRHTEDYAGQISFQSNVVDFTNVGESPPIGALTWTESLRSDLSAFSNNNAAIDSVYLYHAEQHTLVTQSMTTSFLGEGGYPYFPDVSWMADAQKAAERNIRSFWLDPRLKKQGNGEKDKSVLTFIRLLPLFSSDYRAALIVNLDTASISRLFNRFPTGTQGELLVFTEDGKLIAAGGTLGNLGDRDLDEVKSLLRGGGIGSSTFRLKDSGYFATLARSSYNGWQYAMLVPARTFTKQVQLLKEIIIVTAIFLSIVALLTAYFSFGRVQKGVLRIFDALFKIQPEAPHADRIARVENTIAQLLQESEKNSPLLRTHYLMSSLLGNAVSIEKLSDKKSQFAFPNPVFAVMAVEMDRPQAAHRFGEKDETLFLFSVANIAKELLQPLYPAEIVVFQKYVIVILNLPESAAAEKESIAMAQHISNAVKRYLKQTVTIGCGKQVNDIREFSVSYHEAIKSLHLNWVKSGDEILTLSKVDPLTGYSAAYPHETEQTIVEGIHAGDRAVVLEGLKRFTGMLQQSEVSFSLMKTFYMQLLVSILRVAQEYDEGLRGIYADWDPYSQFLLQNDPDDLADWMMVHVVDPLIRFIQELQQRRTHSLASLTMDMIHERYHQDLSLQLAADVLKVSPSYLSQVFKEAVGDTFIHYVTRYRVEQSKQLLTATSLTVAEVASRVGYGNPQQLIRVFKKLEGKTPGEYRNRQM